MKLIKTNLLATELHHQDFLNYFQPVKCQTTGITRLDDTKYFLLILLEIKLKKLQRQEVNSSRHVT